MTTITFLSYSFTFQYIRINTQSHILLNTVYNCYLYLSDWSRYINLVILFFFIWLSFFPARLYNLTSSVLRFYSWYWHTCDEEYQVNAFEFFWNDLLPININNNIVVVVVEVVVARICSSKSFYKLWQINIVTKQITFSGYQTFLHFQI